MFYEVKPRRPRLVLARVTDRLYSRYLGDKDVKLIKPNHFTTFGCIKSQLTTPMRNLNKICYRQLPQSTIICLLQVPSTVRCPALKRVSTNICILWRSEMTVLVVLLSYIITPLSCTRLASLRLSLRVALANELAFHCRSSCCSMSEASRASPVRPASQLASRPFVISSWSLVF